MATDEEYLDNLLKNAMDSESQNRTMDEVMDEVRRSTGVTEQKKEAAQSGISQELRSGDRAVYRQEEAPVSSDELADMLDKIENLIQPESEPVVTLEEAAEESAQIHEDSQTNDDKIWQEGLDELLQIMEQKQEEQDNDEASAAVAEEEVLPEAVSWPEAENEPIVEPDAALQTEQSLQLEIDSEQMDVTDLIDNMNDADENLQEINDLLKKSDHNETVETDMLDSLGSIDDNPDGEEGFLEDGSADALMEKDGSADVSGKEDRQAKKARKKQEKLEKKAQKAELARRRKEEKAARKAKKNEKNIETEPNEGFDVPISFPQEEDQGARLTDEPDVQESDAALEDDLAALLGGLDFSDGENAFGTEPEKNQDTSEHTDESSDKTEPESSEPKADETEPESPESEDEDAKPGEEKEKKKKKSGFLSGIMDFLSQEQDDELQGVSDENAAIMQELEAEDQENAEKKAQKEKKKKKKDGAKKGKKAPKQKKEKKQKVKPPKVKKEKPPVVPERPARSLNKKNLIVLTAFCVTIFAAIYMVTTFIPEYVDMNSARDAFYQGDYETVYTLLYKKKLSSTEEAMYNKARTVLIVQRRLESYENNMLLGRELEAVDSLVQGINRYDILMSEGAYGAEAELLAIYQQICNILEQNYGLTPEQVRELNYFKSDEYTAFLDKLIKGEAQTMGQQDTTQDAAGEPGGSDNLPADMLPEEAEMISDQQ